MQVSDKLIKPLTEAKYLNADNVSRYRCIMRIFFKHYEKLKYWLYQEEVYEEMIQDPLFADYRLEQCQQDLTMLTEWKNLNTIQDTKKVASIEEFKNKKYRYQMTEYSVEIERLVIRLENLFIEGASLEPTLLERIRRSVEHFPDMAGKDKIDIMSIVTPKNIKGKCRFYQVNYSLAVNPYSSDSRRMGNDSFFKITKDDLMDSPKHDAQLGGFGEFFFEAMLILLIVFILLKKDKNWRLVAGFILFLYLCLFLLPTGFLVRYVPFFYFVPCVLISYILYATNEKYKKGFALVAMGLLLLDSLFSLAGVVAINIQQRVQTDYIVQQIKAKKSTVYVYSQSVQLHNKLNNAGCKYQNGNILKDKKNKNQIDLIGVKMQTNLTPEDFNSSEMPLLMQKIAMFQLKFSKL